MKMILIGTSGRSGSYGLAQALNLIPGVEAHHQYACVQVQKIGTLYYRNYISRFEAMAELDKIYGAAYRYGRCKYWIDISNKIPWVSGLLADMFGWINSFYVVRDGKKVCTSYYHKLPGVYDHTNMWPLANYLAALSGSPPPEERFWWPYARQYYNNRWALLCWHWQESYRYYNAAVTAPTVFRFEDLVSGSFAGFLEALGLPESEEAEEYLLSKPHNVIEPKNYLMTDYQLEIFEDICGQLYRDLGYKEAYKVEYLQPV